MTKYLIYKHTNSITGEAYIGQTCNYLKRVDEHKACRGSCPKFHNAIKKYGWDAFTSEILCDNLTLDEANIKEVELIKSHNTQHPHGYNLAKGGQGYARSQEFVEHCKRNSLFCDPEFQKIQAARNRERNKSNRVHKLAE